MLIKLRMLRKNLRKLTKHIKSYPIHKKSQPTINMGTRLFSKAAWVTQVKAARLADSVASKADLELTSGHPAAAKAQKDSISEDFPTHLISSKWFLVNDRRLAVKPDYQGM